MSQTFRASACGSQMLAISTLLTALEVEGVEQVVECRAVGRHVRVALGCLGIGIVVAAAGGQRSQTPVPFDELGQRDVVGIAVVHVAAGGEGGHDDQWNPSAIAEEVERLNVAGIIVAAALVEGDEDGYTGPLGRVLNRIYDLLGECLKQVKLRRG